MSNSQVAICLAMNTFTAGFVASAGVAMLFREDYAMAAVDLALVALNFALAGANFQRIKD
jgi:hypothetical protein